MTGKQDLDKAEKRVKEEAKRIEDDHSDLVQGPQIENMMNNMMPSAIMAQLIASVSGGEAGTEAHAAFMAKVMDRLADALDGAYQQMVIDRPRIEQARRQQRLAAVQNGGLVIPPKKD